MTNLPNHENITLNITGQQLEEQGFMRNLIIKHRYETMLQGGYEPFIKKIAALKPLFSGNEALFSDFEDRITGALSTLKNEDRLISNNNFYKLAEFALEESIKYKSGQYVDFDKNAVLDALKPKSISESLSKFLTAREPKITQINLPESKQILADSLKKYADENFYTQAMKRVEKQGETFPTNKLMSEVFDKLSEEVLSSQVNYTYGSKEKSVEKSITPEKLKEMLIEVLNSKTSEESKQTYIGQLVHLEMSDIDNIPAGRSRISLESEIKKDFELVHFIPGIKEAFNSALKEVSSVQKAKSAER
jgi:hypothetical protein